MELRRGKLRQGQIFVTKRDKQRREVIQNKEGIFTDNIVRNDEVVGSIPTSSTKFLALADPIHHAHPVLCPTPPFTSDLTLSGLVNAE